jgi:hypothetical protein
LRVLIFKNKARRCLVLNDSEYTTAIRGLIDRIQQSSPKQDSLFELAALYFTSSSADARVIRTCQENVQSTEDYLSTAPSKKKVDIQKQLKNRQKELKEEQQKQLSIRQQRYKCVASICIQVLRLAEGKDQTQTNVKSARLLATLFMLSSTESNNRMQMHQIYKPLYKAVLALRLLDKVLMNNNLTNDYIVARYNPQTRFSKTPGTYSQFQLEVAIPVIIAAIIQDIGMQHVEIQRLLHGADGSLDEFRVLDKGTRVPLLMMNHEQTQDFIENAVGTAEFGGDDPDKKVHFDKRQINRLKFVVGLLNDAIKPKAGSIGNIIKIPQIYSSFILSTKPNYNFQDLPKVITVLNNAARHGGICTNAAASFIDLVGHFPLGFGVIYVTDHQPEDQLQDYYYAIVTKLNPLQPDTPICRKITAQGEISDDTKDFNLTPDNNLFHLSVQKTLDNLTDEQLAELRQAHMRDLNDSKIPELVAGFWNPYRYFSISKHQNLWT